MICDHLNTTRVSSDLPDYIECLDCHKQFTESEWIDFVSQYATEQDWFQHDMQENEATGN